MEDDLSTNHFRKMTLYQFFPFKPQLHSFLPVTLDLFLETLKIYRELPAIFIPMQEHFILKALLLALAQTSGFSKVNTQPCPMAMLSR